MIPPYTHVALLRGINVGGKNVIRMPALAASFESMGLADVRTYIQSGNVLFRKERGESRRLEEAIAGVLSKRHRYDAKVVVRSREEMARIVEGIPKSWRRPSPEWKYNVLFLRAAIDDEAIVRELGPKKGIEAVSYRPGVLYWSACRSDAGRTAMVKLSSSGLYQEMTVRNFNTTRTLAELMGAAG